MVREEVSDAVEAWKRGPDGELRRERVAIVQSRNGWELHRPSAGVQRKRRKAKTRTASVSYAAALGVHARELSVHWDGSKDRGRQRARAASEPRRVLKKRPEPAVRTEAQVWSELRRAFPTM